MAKRNIGVLPMNTTYKILNLYYGEGIDMCQNCGRVIVNVALIEDAEGKKFTVGLDCANTLESQEISNYREFEQNKKEYRNFVSRILAIRKLMKEDKINFVKRLISKDGTISYKVYYGIVGSIGTYNVYKQYRQAFGERVEKTFRSKIEDCLLK